MLVQGPPGTGKTHTIANLLTHAVAQGKRVLVSSHRAALEVLKDKLPEEVRHLAIQRFGEQERAEDLRNSLETLSARKRLPEFEPSALQKQVDEISSAMARTSAEVDNRLAELAVLRQAQAESMKYAPGFVGSAGDVAEMISSNLSRRL